MVLKKALNTKTMRPIKSIFILRQLNFFYQQSYTLIHTETKTELTLCLRGVAELLKIKTSKTLVWHFSKEPMKEMSSLKKSPNSNV